LRNLLPLSFYARSPVDVARDLLGVVLRRDDDTGSAAGRIVETEAYLSTDPACHAYRGRTARNASLFGPPGAAYVYLSYGVHWLFNVATGREGEGCGVLIRALEPTEGLELMRQRRGRVDPRELASGPGKLAAALGITGDDDGSSLAEGRIGLVGPSSTPGPITVCRRVGISTAVAAPLRFYLTANPHVSQVARV